MLRRLLIAAAIALAPSLAAAQFATIAPTAPPSDNGNRIANTAWVRANGGGTSSLPNGNIFVGNVSNVATAQSMSGDATLSNAGVLTLATVLGTPGTFGSATGCIVTTQNAKGLTTAISVVTCAPAIGSITGLGTGIAAALAINTGSAGAPVLFNGALGTPTSGNLANATGLPIGSGVSGIGSGVATALATNVGAAGSVVVNGGAGGTPSSLTLTNATGLPVAGGGTGVASMTTGYLLFGNGTGAFGGVITNAGTSGLAVVSNGAAAPTYQLLSPNAISSATGIGTWMGTPSSANLRAAVTDETGTGLLYFQGGDIGTPSAGVGTNLTALNGTQLTSGTIPAARTNGHQNGTATNDNGAAGEIGEIITATQSTPQALSTGTALTIVTLPLTAGDWDMSCTISYAYAATTVAQTIVASVSATTNTLGSLGAINSFNFGTAGVIPNGGFTVTSPPVRQAVASTTNFFCVAFSGFTTSTATATAFGRARRAR